MLINAYCTIRELPPLDFPHKLVGQRDRTNAEMLAHLDGFLDYLFPDGSEMSSGLYSLMRHVQRVRHQLSMEVAEGDIGAFSRWLELAQGVAFLPDGSVRDSKGRSLFHPQEGPDEDARLPVSGKAIARKMASDSRLATQGVDVPPHLPVVLSEDELEPRLPSEVAERALGLFLAALRAESLGAGDPIPVADIKERQPLGFAALSPAELAYMEEPEPPLEATVPMSWRYEALFILLWALKLLEMTPPTETCDVSRLVGLIMDLDEREMIDSATLREPSEILDALDYHYRAHWASRQAELAQTDPPGGLVQGVVMERHYALNWLTRFEDAPWDEIDTPT